MRCSETIKNILIETTITISNIYENASIFINSFVDDEVFRITIAFVPGLISISYPLIIQTISRLNDQYKSTHIIDRFRKERRHKWFFWSLICSVMITLLCVTKYDGLRLLGFLSIVNLLLAFFFNIRLLLTYQSGKELFDLYSKRLDIIDCTGYEGKPKMIMRKKAQILGAWHSLIDLYNYAITARDRKLQEDIRQNFMTNAFRFIRDIEQRDQEIVLFPTEFYNSTYDIIATFIRNKDDHYHQNVEYFVGSAFFRYNHENKQFLSQQTFQAIWKNISLLIENGFDEKIIRYWENAHQYCLYNLETHQIQYDDNYEETEPSRNFRRKLAGHKTEFIQLHTVLGAYLMHKKKYKTLYKIWFFTQSQPPSYVLVPQTMAEVFKQYFLFRGSGIFDSGFKMHYFFKDLEFDAMNGKEDVRLIVRNYLCLLFLKQWLSPWQYGYSRLTIPQLPESQSDKKLWEENIKYFRKGIEKLLSDDDLLKELHLDWITRDKCSEKLIPYPLDFLDELEQALKDGFQETLKNLKLDAELTKQFDDFTVACIKEAYDMFSRVNGEEVNRDNRDHVSDAMQVIRGERTVIDKEAFVINTSTSYIGFQTFLGSKIKNDYCGHVATKFSANTTIRYQVKQELLFQAVDRLKLQDEHAIVALNVDTKYLQESGKIDFQMPLTDEDCRYNDVPLYHITASIPFVDYTLYILRKKDFPMIRHKDWKELSGLSEDVKQGWEKLVLIDESLKIYRKFTELDKDEELLNHYLEDQTRNEDELRNMVEINVDFLGFCWFRKEIKIVSISVADTFQEGGIQNALDDIEPF